MLQSSCTSRRRKASMLTWGRAEQKVMKGHSDDWGEELGDLAGCLQQKLLCTLSKYVRTKHNQFSWDTVTKLLENKERDKQLETQLQLCIAGNQNKAGEADTEAQKVLSSDICQKNPCPGKLQIAEWCWVNQKHHNKIQFYPPDCGMHTAIPQPAQQLLEFNSKVMHCLCLKVWK